MTLTVGKVAKAIRKNGYKQTFGEYIQRSGSGKVIGACALGQAAVNLGFEDDPGGLTAALNQYKDADGQGLGDQIINWNDEKHLPLPKIAQRIERLWIDYLDEPVNV